ncbi:cardiomyopathy-associated protein 5 [Pseudorasbora parva]|uniref:cardiomyopathy-associated protein 5 n=1 Tax=Pseudorasbora parva TaxID=51549 RepID=UPI00351DEBAC
MEMMDPESQMTALDSAPEEALDDELDDLSNSLRAVVQDGGVKPKLHCLMMDPSFSMVTVQSEDSGIVWETASSRCSTPWASEFNAPESAYCTSGAAGRIVFIMDEQLMSRRKKRKTKTLTQVSHEILAEADRPAMVEVSMPNVGAEADRTSDLKEERLFSLVSEGSEILNIIAPPKVSTVDEEESKGLEDNLYYLEETPTVKSTDIPEEPESHPEMEIETIHPVIPEPVVPFPQVSRRGAEEYFEEFALLYDQAPSGLAPVEEILQEMEEKDAEDAPLPEVTLGVSSTGSLLDISEEHLDDVFYGGGSEPHALDANASAPGWEFSQSSPKESGSALFGNEEPVLTPIYLPEGPRKIIDPNLLEEPKAMAFLYSDLYADAVGIRKKTEDDVESVTSEKSFHSRESDSEDRGYLEKFALTVETLPEIDVTCVDRHEPFGFAGFVERNRADEENPGEEQQEITDFFRNSASSSPCEPMERLEPEEEPEVVRTPRVTFGEQVPKRSEERESDPPDHTDFSDEFLPVELSEDCPAWEENLPTIAVKPAREPKPVSDNSRVPNTVKPASPRLKPFLDLTPLLPVEIEDDRDTAGEKQEEEPTPKADPADAPDAFRKSD